MAFMISRGGSSLSEKEKASLNQSESEEKESAAATVGPVSNRLYLKSSSKASSQTLDKQVVLRRIRHRKSLNKVKSAFEALLGSSQGNTTSAQLPKWLEQEDAFSAP